MSAPGSDRLLNLELLLDSTSEALVQIGPEGRCEYLNRAAEELFGYTSEEVIGKQVHQLVHHSYPNGRAYPLEDCPIYKAIREGVAHRQEHDVFWRKDGTAFPVEYNVRPLISNGVLAGGVVAIHEISERLRLEAEARKHERQLSAFFKHATVGMAITDPELRFVQVNEALAKINGRTVSEHIGCGFEELLPSLAPMLRPLLEEVIRTGVPLQNLPVSGQTAGAASPLRHWNCCYFPLYRHDGAIAGLGTVVVEVTEFKRVQEELRKSEELFRQLAETIEEVFWITTPDHSEILYVSPGYETIWGRPCASLYARPSSWMEAIHPGDREAVTKELRVCGGRDYDLTYRVLRPDNSFRWIRDRAFPVLDRAGKLVRIVGVAEDVTERKSLEEQLLQAQKMEAIGILAGGVAHDFNNILSVIQGHGHLLQTAENLDDELRDSVSEVLGAAERAAHLTRQLLTFSRKQIAQMQPLDLNATIGGTLKMLRAVIGEDVEVKAELAEGLPKIAADPTLLMQVLMNLAVNSRDAMPDGGRLTVATRATVIDPAHLAEVREAKAGPAVKLSVEDTGQGIAPEHLEHIFEPFFTTKAMGKGTGLGLSIVYGIVKQHQGWIELESTVGKGTCFNMFFPVAAVERSGAAVTGEGQPLRGNETILLVEDDPSVRMLTRKVLERFGYQVIEAPSALAATKIWEDRSKEIDLLITDILMPGGMSGVDLANFVRRSKAELPIIFVSGYSADLLADEYRTHPQVSYLQKPFLPSALTQTIRERLAR